MLDELFRAILGDVRHGIGYPLKCCPALLQPSGILMREISATWGFVSLTTTTYGHALSTGQRKTGYTVNVYYLLAAMYHETQLQ